MKISARNVFEGKIESVEKGAVNGIVAIKVGDELIKADITNEAIDALELEAGKSAYAIIKATSVMFAAGGDKIANISARNQLPGTVVEVNKGAVNGHVAIEIAGGERIKGSITNEAIDALGLTEGAKATAIIKSTEVIVGID